MLLLLLPISLLFLRVFMPDISKNENQKKVYIFLCFLMVLFFVGLRSVHTGSMDTLLYSRLFGTANRISDFADFLRFNDIATKDYLLKEGNFYLLVWLIARVTDNAQLFLVIITAIITACVFKFMSDHSEDFMLSCMAYVCLGSMTFTMNGMRQALAMAICLLAYGFAVKKKFIPFVLIVLLAMTFHFSAFIFLIVYPLSHFSKFHPVPLLIAGGLFIAFSSRFAQLYDRLTENDYALGESMEGGGFVIVAIYVLVLVLVWLFRKNFGAESNMESLFALFFAGFIIYITRYFSTQIFERTSYYFFYFAALMIPKLSRIFKERDRLIYSVVVCALALILFAYRINSSAVADYRLFFMG